MNAGSKLILIKIIHTMIWVFFNVVILYLLFAVIAGSVNKWVWIGPGLFFIEGIVLVAFNMKCPLTVIARNYSDSTKDNFDIYLPDRLAKYNKIIYTSILVLIIAILIYRLIIE